MTGSSSIPKATPWNWKTSMSGQRLGFPDIYLSMEKELVHVIPIWSSAVQANDEPSPHSAQGPGWHSAPLALAICPLLAHWHALSAYQSPFWSHTRAREVGQVKTMGLFERQNASLLPSTHPRSSLPGGPWPLLSNGRPVTGPGTRAVHMLSCTQIHISVWMTVPGFHFTNQHAVHIVPRL